jgi:hypothetical protein
LYSRVVLFQVLVGILGAVVAAKKGRNPFVWGLVCFIFPLVIVVLGFLPPVLKTGRTRLCPYCSKMLQESATECKYCGKEMPINMVQCKECGSFVPEKDYCMQCNRKLRV